MRSGPFACVYRPTDAGMMVRTKKRASVRCHPSHPFRRPQCSRRSRPHAQAFGTSASAEFIDRPRPASTRMNSLRRFIRAREPIRVLCVVCIGSVGRWQHSRHSVLRATTLTEGRAVSHPRRNFCRLLLINVIIVTH